MRDLAVHSRRVRFEICLTKLSMLAPSELGHCVVVNTTLLCGQQLSSISYAEMYSEACHSTIREFWSRAQALFEIRVLAADILHTNEAVVSVDKLQQSKYVFSILSGRSTYCVQGCRPRQSLSSYSP